MSKNKTSRKKLQYTIDKKSAETKFWLGKVIASSAEVSIILEMYNELDEYLIKEGFTK